MLEFVNKLVYSTRAHQNTWGRVSQAWKRVPRRDDEVWTLHNVWDIQRGCWQICRRTMAVLLHMCSGFPTEILKQMIMTSLYDVTSFSHLIEGGNYKREHNRASGLLLLLSSGCFDTSVWVFVSHQPSTLAVSVPLE